MMADPSMPVRRPSPGLTLELSSNNPFRNRAGSPALPSPALGTPHSAGSRPLSRNPFLSTFEAEFNKEASKSSQLIDMSATVKDSPKQATFGTSAEELFKNLTLDESAEKRPPPRGPPPPRNGNAPPQGHRPTRSGENEGRPRGPPPRGPPRPRGPPGPQPPHQSSPERRENRRPRRNSESSMIDKGSLNPEEERRRRERRRERENRAKDGKSRSSRPKKPQGLDLIDKLDVSGIYGPSLFHHDGPFDACNPHRNRKKDHRAPMEAFPVGSANNALGGSGPVNKNIDLETFHGRGTEGFTDFATSGATEFKKRPELEGRAISFNPKDRGDIIHGEESYGLGTSTFLEGAPASRTAMQRRESENEASALANGGIGRKKSIAQRIRGISQPRRGFGEGNPRITSPESRYRQGQNTPGSPPQAQSAGGVAKANEMNPFFDEYDEAYEKKGATIKVADVNTNGGPSNRSPTSPPPPSRNPLTRAVTTDSVDNGDGSKASNGFLSRVKSLKGGRRQRPERPV
ncbi:Pal1 cell morphology protein-domain-containing protein [Clohesyomyces aquaticus]|uniref:Pal1 cell morphology protein-domain-containing protein n=1 Tax=Clohesyomyces aquaticus TaxID=1231657 RepID=A0A1Y1ZRR7_9PLEO|nr:Pal1 cell morphology protein-domain-containing protein [Clohesyomyces aquaticus]